jgi:phthalate 4,5-dioxygenase oxygenase subunit
MLSTEQNNLVTRTGPGTGAGELMRRYWQPAALTDELAPESTGNRALIPVRLFGEDLVLFRDEQNRYGLLEKHCCHRGADLNYGRLEDGGLRCPFHGWLFDVTGACMEQPGEPDASNFHTKVRQKAYPCEERNGVVFAYMGPGEPPPFPDYDCFKAPDNHSFAFKGLVECNWLQALEVGIDPAHASYLHRFFEDEDPDDASYGQQFRGQAVDLDMPATRLFREFPRPDINVEETEFGLRILSLRALDAANTHVRVTNLTFPNAFVIPLGNDMIITQWHVPIDDEHNYWYAIFSSYEEVLDKNIMRADRERVFTIPGYRPLRNKSNNYGFDAEEQRDATYTGMGMDINTHDQWAVESLGAIQDRTQEHLGVTDKAIIAYRRQLIGAIDDVVAGNDAPMRAVEGAQLRGPVAIDAIGPPDAWRECWKERDSVRRDSSPWATNPW